MTDDELNAIQARADAATKGPWGSDEVKIYESSWNDEEPEIALRPHKAWRGNWSEDSEFIFHARDDIPDLLAEVKRLREQKDGAYVERDALVCALSKIFPSTLSRHPDSDTTWDNDWRWIVFVNLPTGQASWHIHDSEVGMFDHLERKHVEWDGHTNAEKYARLAALAGKDPE